MARYIYDEVKKQLNDEFGIRTGSKEDGADIHPMLIIKVMATIAHEQYKCSAPGEIPDDKMDEYKNEVYKRVCKLIGISEYILSHKKGHQFSSFIVSDKKYQAVQSMVKLSNLIKLGIIDDIDLKGLGLN